MWISGKEAASQSGTSRDRLVQAVIDLWHDAGAAGISARQISMKAAVPVSSLYHHFGSLDGLLTAAQVAVLHAAEEWRDAQFRDIGGDLPPAAFPALLAALVDDWCREQRALAFGWSEGMLLAARDPDCQAIRDDWNNFWAEFWFRLCGLFHLEQHAAITARLFENEFLNHMIEWHRPVDRACLEELCHGWVAWLTGEPTPDAPWRDRARIQAERARVTLPDRDEISDRIANSCAQIVVRSGAAKLTHRAVATEADLTLGVVSNRFRTSAGLLQVAFETLYRRAVGASSVHSSVSDRRDRTTAMDQLVALVCHSSRGLGPQELRVTVARDPQFKPFALQLRYLRGRTTGQYLQALLGHKRVVSTLDAALFSGCIAGLVQAHADTPEEELQALCRQDIEQILFLLT